MSCADLLASTNYPKTMNTIWKYELGIDEKITTPRGAVLLTVAAQGTGIFAWFEVETDNPVDDDHVFEVFGTGHEIPADPVPRRYVGTVFLRALVFHVYEANSGGVSRPHEG